MYKEAYQNAAQLIQSGQYEQERKVKNAAVQDERRGLLRKRVGEAAPEPATEEESYSDFLASYFAAFNRPEDKEVAPEFQDNYQLPGEEVTTDLKDVKQTNISGKEDFIAKMMPLAKEVGAKIGVDPRIIVAQAALESAWGKSAPGNNFFGVKSHGKGGGNKLTTKEVINGKTVTVQDSFRGYESIGESVEDYGNFLLENPRYSAMLNAKGLENQIAALGESGYATDPKYAEKIYSIASALPSDSLVPKRRPQ